MVPMTIFRLLLSILWIAFLAYWLISSIGAKKTVGRKGNVGVRIIITIVLFSVLESAAFRQFSSIRDIVFSSTIVNSLGILLCILGLALAIWARRHLGRNWGMPMSLKENTDLVTTGPYAWVRHPIYTGILLAILGTVFVTSALWLVPFIFFCWYFIHSAGVEEGIMSQQFPNGYPAYQKRTKMLIPFVF